MKIPLPSSWKASLVVIMSLTANPAIFASTQPSPDPDQNKVEEKQDVRSSGADANEKGNSTTRVNVDSQGIILKGYDAVAYFKQRRAVPGDPAIKSKYMGATYLFASIADKNEFDKDPAKYAPKYGGFCAYSVANGVIADVEGPDAFAVYKGSLYVCGNQAALQDFKSKIEDNVKAADANWARLNRP